jgi:hypothetical protein
MVEPKPPKEFEDCLGPFGPQLFDGWCGEPIGWGFKITKHVGEERWGKLGEHGSLECAYPSWFLITKKLTREEAIEKYGPVTDEELGPRGGWKNVTFGEKKFGSRWLMEQL